MKATNRRTHLLRGVLVIAGLLTVLAARAGTKTAMVDGIPHIQNSAEPADGIRTLHLRERWRVGGDEDEILMGVICDALLALDGTLLLLDRQLGQILAYSGAGEYLRTLSREGDGPGELRQPRSMLWLDDGSLGILDRTRGRITRLDTAGEPLSSIILQDAAGLPTGSLAIDRAASSAGTFALHYRGRHATDEGRQQFEALGFFSPDGVIQHEIMEVASGFDFANRSFDETYAYFPRAAWGLDNAGRLLYAPERDAYRIETLAPDGSLVRVLTRDYVPRRRSKEDKEQMAAGHSMSINGEIVELRTSFLDTDPVISALHVDEENRLWVEHSRSRRDLPLGVIRSFDLFDAAGEFIAIVHIGGEATPDRDLLLPLGGGRFALVLNYADARDAMWAAYSDAEEPAEEPEPLAVAFMELVAEP